MSRPAIFPLLGNGSLYWHRAEYDGCYAMPTDDITYVVDDWPDGTYSCHRLERDTPHWRRVRVSDGTVMRREEAIALCERHWQESDHG